MGQAHKVEGERKGVAVEGENGKCHVPAVAASGDGDAVGIKIGLGGNPVKEGVDVLIGILSLEAVVEQGKALAVAGGPANVGIDQDNPELIQKEVVAPEKRRH